MKENINPIGRLFVNMTYLNVSQSGTCQYIQIVEHLWSCIVPMIEHK